MMMGIRRFASLDLPINVVIDVGAAAGTWSTKASIVWPYASYLLVEPLVERKSVLESLASQHSNFRYFPFAAGNATSSLDFLITEDLDGSGVASSISDRSQVRSVPVIRLDDVVKENNKKGPYVVKLDTHGFEVPIIEGCSGFLNEVSLFIIECYGFKIADNSLLFWEMCQYMDRLGFRLFDIVDVMYRPRDGAFWQCDAFFIKNTNEIFNYNKYK